MPNYLFPLNKRVLDHTLISMNYVYLKTMSIAGKNFNYL